MNEKQVLTLKSSKFVLKVPPPWELKGEGILVLFRFSKDWIQEKSGLSEEMKAKFRGGFGYVMFVNYEESPVGPYREVLFIPGRFRKKRHQVISRIVVDSETSTRNGQENWGIPKETLPITWVKEKNRDLIQVQHSGKTVFSAEVSHGGISFPLSTALMPISLCQSWKGLKYYTKPTGYGWAKFAKLKQVELDPNLFPDIRGVQPLMAVRVSPFTMNFPEPYFKDELP